MIKHVLVVLAPGFEEVEALAPVDILRRAGADVTLAGLTSDLVIGRNRIGVMPDVSVDAALELDFDMIVLPGGAIGVENLKKDERVIRLLNRLEASGAFVAAICAAPTVLAVAGVIKGRTVTSHPGVRALLVDEKISEDRVVVDRRLITSQGPGTAMEFSFALVCALFGAEKAATVNEGVLARV